MSAGATLALLGAVLAVALVAGLMAVPVVLAGGV